MPAQWTPRTCYISSKYATAVYNSTFNSSARFQLQQPISVPDDYELYVSVVSASIPFSFYAVPASVVTYTLNGTAVNLSIPAGNWSATDLAGYLTDSNVSTSYSTQTGFFTMTCGSAVTVSPSTLFGITAATTGTSISSAVIPDIAGTRFINVLTNLGTDFVGAGSLPNAPVLASIPVSVAPNYLNTYLPGAPPKLRIKTNTLSSLDVQLTDDDLNLLNLNGGQWALTLFFEIMPGPDSPSVFSEAPRGMNLFDATSGKYPRVK